VRVALLGGIYSNHIALARTLADAKARQVDAVYCLGDLGAFGPHPTSCFRCSAMPACERSGELRRLARAGARRLPVRLHRSARQPLRARLSYRYTFEKTSPGNKAWLGTLPGRSASRSGESEFSSATALRGG
jgi:hypothetical protein